MAVSKKMIDFARHSSWIRKMFEEGARLKERYGAENVFDFSLGNPDLPPPPHFYRVLREVASERGPGRHAYMANGGYPFARGKVAAQVSLEQGVELTGGDVLMTCGAAGALNVTLKALLDAGDEVIILAPFFVEYHFYIDNHGGVAKVVDTDEDFNIDTAAVEKAITPRTKAVIINSPHNPTGRIYPADDLRILGKTLTAAGQKNGQPIYLISDEPYRKIVYDGRVVPSVFQAYEHSVVLSSYSKDLSLPGERIGFLAVHPEIEDKDALLGAMTLANRILGFVNAPAIMQRVVAEMQGETIDCAVYARRRATFCSILSDHGYTFAKPEGAFYIFPESPLQNDVDFVGLLREEKVLAVPGRGFGRPGYFRLAYCVEDSVIERSAAAFGRAMEKARELNRR